METSQVLEPPSALARWLSGGQAALYVAAGLWPIVHLRSFTAVTGPKPEGWLVKTIGGLISVIGGTLGWAYKSRRVTPELRFLATGAALTLAVADVIYTSKRRISPVYLLDVLPEVVLAGGWMIDGWMSRSRTPSMTTPMVPGEPEYLH